MTGKSKLLKIAVEKSKVSCKITILSLKRRVFLAQVQVTIKRVIVRGIVWDTKYLVSPETDR